MHLPEPKNIPYKTLIADIEKGLIKIPQFQRDYVWSIERAAKLIDSILKGYPIGTFITWKTKEPLRVVRNLGGIELPPVPDGDFAEYVLDGQQRLTSLFCALKGVKIRREKREDDFSNIYVDLDATEHEHIVKTDIEGLEEGSYIRLTELIHGGIKALTAYDEKYHQCLDDYKQTLQSYNFSLIEVKEAPLDVATEIFTRINVGGKPLSLFEIMVAKTFDSARSFDLAEKFEELVDRLSEVGYNTISDATVMQTVSLVINKGCKRQNILKIERSRFIDEWPRVIEAVEAAVDYFRGYYRIPVSHLLPYNTILAPFAYFFYKHKDKPTGEKQRFLADFFWRTSLSGRYSSSVESKLAQDIKRIEDILEEKLPEYDYAVDTSAEFIHSNGWFNAGRSYVKAILCIMAYHQPKSFIDGSIVHISNDWLKQANSRNYHHFFPKSYLRKNGYDDDWSNHIANITIVDDFLNKREIGAKAPYQYMEKFRKINPVIEETMLTHLIELEDWGIWEDDYETFLNKRCARLSEEINSRIIPRQSDKEQSQVINIDDVDQGD